MHLRWKRIVHFIIEQVATFFANGNQLAYRIIFFFKAYYCHRFLPQFDDNPAFPDTQDACRQMNAGG
jgi:hypothetical protein